MTATPAIKLLLAVLAVCASAWLYLAQLQDRPAAHAGTGQPALSVEAPDWLLFNTRGEAEKRLSAVRMEQWTAEQPALLVEPRMEIRDPRQRRWLLSARLARVYPDQDPIHFEDDVLLRSAPPETRFSATSSRLQVARSGDRVTSDAPVVLRTGNWHFNAIGLRADLGQQRIELLAQVKGSNE